MQPWVGKIFLNPPFGKTSSGGSNLEHFTRYLREQHECGNTSEAVLLIPVNTATSWFEPLWAYTICFPTFRIRFLQPDGIQGSGQSFGTCLVYLGPNTKRFVEVFQNVKACIQANQVYQFKRPHGMVQSKLQRLVDVRGGSNSLL